MKRVVSREEYVNFINGVDVSELIRRCSLALYDAYDYHGKIAFVIGNNNKGKIALSLASLIKDSCQCDIFINGNYSNEYLEQFDKENIFFANGKNDFSGYDLLIDGLIDSNFTGLNQYIDDSIIINMNDSNKDIISVGINSGLNPNTGIGKNIIKSILTVSFVRFRYGHFLNMAKDYIKKVVNYSLNYEFDSNSYLLELNDFSEVIKDRENFSNKYDYGLVSIIGGCSDYNGSVKLCNMASAALRSGVGVSRLCVPRSIGNAILPCVLESIVYGMQSMDGKMLYNENDLNNAIEKSDCLVIGMGWGKSEEYPKILEFLFNHYLGPIVLDADGINTLSEMDLSIIRSFKGNLILTPHLGEFSRLIKKDTITILGNPVKYARDFAKDNNCILLLKGSTTIITDGDIVYLVDRGCSGMATAGSGDVLTGILGGLLAYNKCDLNVVGAAAYINGIAGEEAEKEVGAVSMMASDTVNHIPAAIKKIKKAIEKYNK